MVLTKFLISVLCVLAPGMLFASERISDPRTGGTRQMAAILRRLVGDANIWSHWSVAGDMRIEELRIELTKETNQINRLRLRYDIAGELLKAGRSEAAIDAYLALRRDSRKLGLPSDNKNLRALYRQLSIAYMRLGEQQNCIANHSTDSCLLPISGSGVHTIRHGSASAVKELLHALRFDPEDKQCMWLLNIAHMTLGSHPDAVPEQWLIPSEAFTSDYDVGRFYDVAAAAGVDIVSLSGSVVMDDLNGDGLLDLLISNWALDGQLRYFHNDGNGKFSDNTRAAGLVGEIGGLNLVHGDYDNDGFVDVFVLRGAWMDDDGQFPNSLLRNLGDGRFDDVSLAAGVRSFEPTQTAAWADYDLDGQLDLFVGNETTHESQAYPCRLFHNNGDGTFSNVAASIGVALTGYVKGAAWGDFNNDGLPDLYVSRYGESNVLYRNNGNTESGWTFSDVTESAGVAAPLGSFPTWTWDYNNDGWLDILVAPFTGFTHDGNALEVVVDEYLSNTIKADRVHLYENRGDGTFRDVSSEIGLDAPLLAMGANFGDLDNDGYLDCYFGTGDPSFAAIVPNRMFRNSEGTRFQDVTSSGGFGHLQKGHGIAFGDIDNDGDQDIYAVMGGAVEGDVYQNALFLNPGHGNHWITLRLAGLRSNRSAIGARIRITVRTPDGHRDIYGKVDSGGSFGASSLQQEIGLGNAMEIERLEIRWPIEDSVQTFTNVPMDCVLSVREGTPNLVKVELPRVPLQGNAPHRHHH